MMQPPSEYSHDAAPEYSHDAAPEYSHDSAPEYSHTVSLREHSFQMRDSMDTVLIPRMGGGGKGAGRGGIWGGGDNLLATSCLKYYYNN